MGFRNHIVRTVVLLALALGVGIAVAIMSGGERARTVRSHTLPVIEHQTNPRLAQPCTHSAAAPICALDQGWGRVRA